MVLNLRSMEGLSSGIHGVGIPTPHRIHNSLGIIRMGAYTFRIGPRTSSISEKHEGDAGLAET